MPGDTTIVFGVPVPSVDPVFLAVVRFHILVGIACVVAGIAAMLSHKRRGRHSTFGTIYYWCLALVVASATGVSVVRWAENYHLFFLGALSLIAATVARTALRHRWRHWVRVHITVPWHHRRPLRSRPVRGAELPLVFRHGGLRADSAARGTMR